MKKQFPKRAKLIAAGGLYKFIPLEQLTAKIVIPVIRKMTLSEPFIDHFETWQFQLTFALRRVLKNYAEYELVDAAKVEVIPQKQQ